MGYKLVHSCHDSPCLVCLSAFYTNRILRTSHQHLNRVSLANTHNILIIHPARNPLRIFNHEDIVRMSNSGEVGALGNRNNMSRHYHKTEIHKATQADKALIRLVIMFPQIMSIIPMIIS